MLWKLYYFYVQGEHMSHCQITCQCILEVFTTCNRSCIQGREFIGRCWYFCGWVVFDSRWSGCTLIFHLYWLLILIWTSRWRNHSSFSQILLNEVAPRPHNSGHHTIESCFTSQYEQHLRAVVGLPLGDPSMKVPAAIMYNILGEDEVVILFQ